MWLLAWVWLSAPNSRVIVVHSTCGPPCKQLLTAVGAGGPSVVDVEVLLLLSSSSLLLSCSPSSCPRRPRRPRPVVIIVFPSLFSCPSSSSSSGPGRPVIVVADAVVLCYSPTSLSLSRWRPFVCPLSSPFSLFLSSCRRCLPVVVLLVVLVPVVAVCFLVAPPSTLRAVARGSGWGGGVVVVPSLFERCSPFLPHEQWLAAAVGIAVVVTSLGLLFWRRRVIVTQLDPLD